MDDKELEQILFEIGKKEIHPSENLVDDTIAFIKNKNIYYLILLSIISYIIAILGITVVGSKYVGLEATVSLLCIIHLIGCISSLGVIIVLGSNKEGEINYEK